MSPDATPLANFGNNRSMSRQGDQPDKAAVKSVISSLKTAKSEQDAVFMG